MGETGQCTGEGRVRKSARDGRWHNEEGEGGCPNLRGLRDGTVREVRLRSSKYTYQTNVGLVEMSGYEFILCIYVCITKDRMLTYVANAADFDSNAMCEMTSNLCSVVIFIQSLCEHYCDFSASAPTALCFVH